MAVENHQIQTESEEGSWRRTAFAVNREDSNSHDPQHVFRYSVPERGRSSYSFFFFFFFNELHYIMKTLYSRSVGTRAAKQ